MSNVSPKYAPADSSSGAAMLFCGPFPRSAFGAEDGLLSACHGSSPASKPVSVLGGSAAGLAGNYSFLSYLRRRMDLEHGFTLDATARRDWDALQVACDEYQRLLNAADLFREWAAS